MALRAPSEIALTKPLSPTSGYLLAVLALVASLALVLLYWRSAQQREMRAIEVEFAAETTEFSEYLQQRLANYQLMSGGAASLFASVAQPSAKQWRDYVHRLQITKQFPAVHGLGFAVFLDRAHLQRFQLAKRDTGEGLFSVHPTGTRTNYGPLIYFDPKTAVQQSGIGYDLYSNSTFRQAMDESRDRGTAALSEATQLPFESKRSVGIVLFAPVYRNGPVPLTQTARRVMLEGWVVIPFDLEKLVQTRLSAKTQPLYLRIIDIGSTESKTLYTNMQSAAIEEKDQVKSTVQLNAMNRHWQLDFMTDKGAALNSRTSDLRLTLAIGVIASLLLFGIALVLARTESQAQAMATRMSESYRRSELRFRSAIEHSTIGYALLDNNGVIVEVNPALAKIFGISVEKLVGTVLREHFIDGHDEPTKLEEREILASGVYRTMRQFNPGHAADTQQLQLTLSPVPGEINQDVTCLAQVEDITERLDSEARIYALNRMLEVRVASRTRELTQANHELESFAYSVSHDLRTPLRAIEGFGKLLAEHAASWDATTSDYLQRIRKATARMDGLIDALLTMTRVSRGALCRVPLNLSQMATEIAEELHTMQPARSISIDIASNLHANGDESLIRNLLQNLLANAWKFTRDTPDARIRVGSTVKGIGGLQEFYVRDNGAGFEEEYSDKLFRPFQRLHDQEQFIGHGIGLASVKRIVERHGGSVRAEGKLGQGATFFFTLPHSEDEVPAETLNSHA